MYQKQVPEFTSQLVSIMRTLWFDVDDVWGIGAIPVSGVSSDLVVTVLILASERSWVRSPPLQKKCQRNDIHVNTRLRQAPETSCE